MRYTRWNSPPSHLPRPSRTRPAMIPRISCLTLLFLFAPATLFAAAPPRNGLSVHPERVSLAGPLATAQLIVTRHEQHKVFDDTSSAAYSVRPAGVIAVT